MKYTNINYKVVYLHLYWIFDILFKALQLSEITKDILVAILGEVVLLRCLSFILLTIYVSYIKIHNLYKSACPTVVWTVGRRFQVI